MASQLVAPTDTHLLTLASAYIAAVEAGARDGITAATAEALHALVHPQCTIHTGGFAALRPCCGVDQLLQYIQQEHEAYSGWNMQVLAAGHALPHEAVTAATSAAARKRSTSSLSGLGAAGGGDPLSAGSPAASGGSGGVVSDEGQEVASPGCSSSSPSSSCTVFVLVAEQATNTGPLMGLPPTNITSRSLTLHKLSFDGSGRLTEAWCRQQPFYETRQLLLAAPAKAPAPPDLSAMPSMVRLMARCERLGQPLGAAGICAAGSGQLQWQQQQQQQQQMMVQQQLVRMAIDGGAQQAQQPQQQTPVSAPAGFPGARKPIAGGHRAAAAGAELHPAGPPPEITSSGSSTVQGQHQHAGSSGAAGAGTMECMPRVQSLPVVVPDFNDHATRHLGAWVNLLDSSFSAVREAFVALDDEVRVWDPYGVFSTGPLVSCRAHPPGCDSVLTMLAQLHGKYEIRTQLVDLALDPDVAMGFVHWVGDVTNRSSGMAFTVDSLDLVGFTATGHLRDVVMYRTPLDVELPLLKADVARQAAAPDAAAAAAGMVGTQMPPYLHV